MPVTIGALGALGALGTHVAALGGPAGVVLVAAPLLWLLVAMVLAEPSGAGLRWTRIEINRPPAARRGGPVGPAGAGSWRPVTVAVT